MQSIRGSPPGIRATAETVLRGAKEMPVFASPNLRLCRIVVAVLACIRTSRSGNFAKFEIREAKTCGGYRGSGPKYKCDSQEQRNTQSKGVSVEWNFHSINSFVLLGAQ